ncbi:MAG: hypothetical protein ACREOC_08165 [Gemmatimonadales bacterium]
MLLPLAVALALTDPAPRFAPNVVLATDGLVCLATGYCTVPAGGRGGAPPGGLMYLALGLIGTGILVLRSSARSSASASGSARGAPQGR